MALAGQLRLKVIVDRQSVQRISRQIDAAIATSAKETVRELTKRAVDFLRRADTRLGRRTIAEGWKAEEPKQQFLGYGADVFNAWEGMTFQTPSRAPGSTKTYPIDGKKLLQILIYGARPHFIRPRSQDGLLQFPITPGVKFSQKTGVALTEQGVVAGVFKGPKPSDRFVGFLVRHPGVSGSRIIHAARLLLQDAVAATGAKFARRVSFLMR